MNLPVLQIETNLDMQLEHVKITYIYIYAFPCDFWYMYTSKTSDRNDGEKTQYIYTRNLNIFIKRIRNN